MFDIIYILFDVSSKNESSSEYRVYKQVVFLPINIQSTFNYFEDPFHKYL